MDSQKRHSIFRKIEGRTRLSWKYMILLTLMKAAIHHMRLIKL